MDYESKKLSYGLEMPHPLTNLHTEQRLASAIKRRKIYFSDEVDRESLFEILYYLDRIEYLDSKSGTKEPIEIIVDSFGGSIYSINAILSKIEQMKDSGYEIITTVSGTAISAGFMFLIIGSKRRAFRYSTMMIHQPSFGSYGTLMEVEDGVKETQRLWELMKEIIIKYTKLTDEILEDIKYGKIDKYFSSDTALYYGIVDEVL